MVTRRSALEKEKQSLVTDEQTYVQQLDLLRFQVNEISRAAIKPGEEEQVEAAFRRASNTAKLLDLSQCALAALSQNDSSLFTQSEAVGRALRELQRVDPSASSLLSVHEQALSTLRDLPYPGNTRVDSGLRDGNRSDGKAVIEVEVCSQALRASHNEVASN